MAECSTIIMNMLRSLWTAATGMSGQQFQIDTIANNLSNVNTIGFKKNRVDFQDLIYEQMSLAGTPATFESEIPSGIAVGHGVKVAGTQKMFTMGNLQNTGNVLDLAIDSEVGFFRLRLPDGSYGYSRDGSFKIDANRQIVSSDGYLLDSATNLPADSKLSSLAISSSGEMSIQIADNPDAQIIGNLEIVRFANPAGLTAIGKNLFKASAGSGPEITGVPGLDGLGGIAQGFIEMSNVQLVDEMVNMIVAQRAYEANSKSIMTSDSVLATAIGMKR